MARLGQFPWRRVANPGDRGREPSRPPARSTEPEHVPILGVKQAAARREQGRPHGGAADAVPRVRVVEARSDGCQRRRCRFSGQASTPARARAYAADGLLRRARPSPGPRWSVACVEVFCSEKCRRGWWGSPEARRRSTGRGSHRRRDKSGGSIEQHHPAPATGSSESPWDLTRAHRRGKTPARDGPSVRRSIPRETVQEGCFGTARGRCAVASDEKAPNESGSGVGRSISGHPGWS
jgi:hypothetical protein